MGLPLARSGRTAESSRREGGGKDVFGEYGEMKQSTLSHTHTHLGASRISNHRGRVEAKSGANNIRNELTKCELVRVELYSGSAAAADDALFFRVVALCGLKERVLASRRHSPAAAKRGGEQRREKEM